MMLGKKSLILLAIMILLVFLSSFVLANKIEIPSPPLKESYSVGQNITLQVNLYDDQNNLINDNLAVSLEDAEKTTRIEKTIPSNKLVGINIGENAQEGTWTITAKYQDVEATNLFDVETNEVARFEIEGDKLIVTNTGNTRYKKNVYITIGSTVGTKTLDLDLGESINFRLIAPDGTYNIRVTDGNPKTAITRSGVTLTGKVVGILDEKIASGSSPITGGLRPGEESEDIYSGLKNKNFVYVFLIVIIGAGILLAIERNYRKKL